MATSLLSPFVFVPIFIKGMGGGAKSDYGRKCLFYFLFFIFFEQETFEMQSF
jgi:hypothetical protein